LVIEADESDGSLVRYEPAVGVVRNLHKDHKPEPEVLAMFETFVGRAREAVVVGDGDNLSPLVAIARGRRVPVVTFGFGADASVHPEEGSLELGARTSSFVVRGTRFALPVPGRHNVDNALAALACASVVGVPPTELVAPLATFKGVGRRFQTIGVANGVEVIDDFAHNPAKMIAALTTAQRRVAPSGGRVLAVYQPHGYGPTRFLREDFVETFVDALGPSDRDR